MLAVGLIALAASRPERKAIDEEKALSKRDEEFTFKVIQHLGGGILRAGRQAFNFVHSHGGEEA